MGLTAKRRAFVNAVVSGLNPSEAYRSAGYSCSRMSAKSIANEAQKLLHVPDISRAIEEGNTEAAKKASWSRETALERLQEVNDIALQDMRNKGHAERESTSAFMESFDRLQDMTASGEGMPKVVIFDDVAALVPISYDADEAKRRIQSESSTRRGKALEALGNAELSGNF